MVGDGRALVVLSVSEELTSGRTRRRHFAMLIVITVAFDVFHSPPRTQKPM